MLKKFREKLRNYPIKKKLSASFLFIIALATVVAIVLFSGAEYISSNIKKIYTGPMINASDVGDVKYGLTDLQRAINRILAEGKGSLEQNYSSFEKTVETDVKLVKDAVNSIDKRFKTEKGKNKLSELKEKINEGEKVRPQVMELMRSGEFDEAYDLNYNTYLPIVNEIKSLTTELEQLVNENGMEYYTSSIITNRILVVIAVVIIVIMLMLAITLMRIITENLSIPAIQMSEAAKLMYEGDMSAGKLITYESEDEFGIMADAMRGTMTNLQHYVTEISDTLREIAKGDLTKDSDEITDFKGDFIDIKDSFVYILKHFNTTLNNIQDTSEHVEHDSAEISKAADDLSKGTTDQASAVEELTATVETVAALAETSAKNTQTALDDISEAVEIAFEERKKMDSLSTEMQNIIDISKKIEEIISTIEDIASQTNLLALNASIEAARAGDAGKGFAVVADQIGKLATDSSNSAVNTRELIVKTIEEINKGSDITKSVVQAFETTIDRMKKFADVAKTTNESAKDQADALSQIEEGIEQISAVTQNTAAASQESSAVSVELAQRAEQLDKLVHNFKLY